MHIHTEMHMYTLTHIGTPVYTPLHTYIYPQTDTYTYVHINTYRKKGLKVIIYRNR